MPPFAALRVDLKSDQPERFQAALKALHDQAVAGNEGELTASAVLDCLLQLVASTSGSKPHKAAIAQLLATWAATPGPLQALLTAPPVAATLYAALLVHAHTPGPTRPHPEEAATPAPLPAAPTLAPGPGSAAAKHRPPTPPRLPDIDEAACTRTVLEALLRCLAFAAWASPDVAACLVSQDLKPLASLLRPNAGLCAQVCVLRLLTALLRDPRHGWQRAANAGVVTAAAKLAACAGHAAQLRALKLLILLAAAPGAPLVVMQQEGLPQTLMALLLDLPSPGQASQQQQQAPLAPGAATQQQQRAGVKSAPAGLEAAAAQAKQAARSDLQAAAATLLAACSRHSLPITAHLLHARAPQALASLLPDAWQAGAVGPGPERDAALAARQAAPAAAAAAAAVSRPDISGAGTSTPGDPVQGAYKPASSKAACVEVQARILGVVAAMASWQEASAALLAHQQGQEVQWSALLCFHFTRGAQPAPAEPAGAATVGDGATPQAAMLLQASALDCLSALVSSQPAQWLPQLLAPAVGTDSPADARHNQLRRVVGVLAAGDAGALSALACPAARLALALATTLQPQHAKECGLVDLIKVLARVRCVPEAVAAQVALAALALPQELLIAPPRPPPPPPPPTPPPPPLPTDIFSWDALGRPDGVDGGCAVTAGGP